MKISLRSEQMAGSLRLTQGAIVCWNRRDDIIRMLLSQLCNKLNVNVRDVSRCEIMVFVEQIRHGAFTRSDEVKGLRRRHDDDEFAKGSWCLWRTDYPSGRKSLMCMRV